MPSLFRCSLLTCAVLTAASAAAAPDRPTMDKRAKAPAPTLTTVAKTPPPPRGAVEIDGQEAGERLGGAVALSEEFLIIGVYRADRPVGLNDPAVGDGAGVAQIHEKSGSGWPLDSVIWPGDAGRVVIDETDVEDDALGRSVDIDEPLAVAGMPGDDEAGGWAGAAAVLFKSGAGWRVMDKIVPDAAAMAVKSVSGWQVGRSVTIEGKWIAVGAPYASFTDQFGVHWAEAGAVLIYRWSPTGWNYTEMLTSVSPSHFEHFGLSVAMDSGTLVVGIPNADNGTDLNGNQGAIEIFSATGSSFDRLNRFGTPTFTQPGARFGESVAINGSTIVVGEPGYAVERGRAWVLEQAFVGDIDWSDVTALDLLVPAPPGIPGGARMGASVDLTDCTVVVGGPGNGVVDSFSGQAWVFARASNTTNAWNYHHIPLWGVNPGDGFGDAVAINSSTVAVGAWLGGTLDAGTVTLAHVECDCDGDGVPDLEQIANDLSLDCNGDGMIDHCQILFDPDLDCDGNDVLDACQFEPPGAFQWPIINGGNGHWYRVDSPAGGVTRLEAQTLASALGGRLASMHSSLEATWVAARAEHDPSIDGEVWLGATQSGAYSTPDGGWGWDDGMSWSWTNWDSGEPDDDDGVEDGEEDGLVASDTDGTVWSWSDVDVDDTITSMLIEFSPDCDDDQELDACQIAVDPSLDCDADGRLDNCQLEEGTGADCNGNGQLDTCDIIAGLAEDCDSDGIPDDCALGDGTVEDCNGNGQPDTCDILDGTSTDADGDLIPDECQLLVINEVLAEPTDLNGDGVANTLDTYVELVNRLPGDLNLSGWQIRIDGVIWHIFAPGSVIEEECCAVVTGGGAPSESVFGAGLLQPASHGFLVSLPDPDDGFSHTISLFDDTVTEQASFTYDSGSSNPGVSAVRCPDIVGDIMLHSECNGAWTTPGRSLTGAFYPGCPAPDSDFDADGVEDADDNCVITWNPDQADCDGDGFGDACAVQFGLDTDCNGNGAPDMCDMLDGTLVDCDGNGVGDACEIAADPSLDCNGTGVLDSCEIKWGWETDCNGNFVVDYCELGDEGVDCDFDGILDICEPGEVEGGPDVTGDCLLNLDDLAMVLANLGCLPPPDCPGDADGDGDCDTDDLELIVNLLGG